MSQGGPAGRNPSLSHQKGPTITPFVYQPAGASVRHKDGVGVHVFVSDNLRKHWSLLRLWGLMQTKIVSKPAPHHALEAEAELPR